MTRPIAQTLFRITIQLDTHTLEEQAQAMAFLAQRYGLPGAYAAANALEERRRQDRERSERHRASRDEEGDRHVTEPTAPTPLVVSAPEKSVQKPKDQALTEEQEAKAKTLLEPDDFAFLMACPEPFKGAWGGHPEWWVSLRDGYPKLPIQREASKCMGWIQGKFSAAQLARMNLRDRLRNWLAKGDRWRENDEMRKAVRR